MQMSNGKPLWYKAVLLACMLFCLSQCIFGVRKYVSEPMFSEMQLVQAVDLPFPGFSICPGIYDRFAKNEEELKELGIEQGDLRDMAPLWKIQNEKLQNILKNGQVGDLYLNQSYKLKCEICVKNVYEKSLCSTGSWSLAFASSLPANTS